MDEGRFAFVRFRLGLDRPVHDPAEVGDRNLQDHHQEDQFPHGVGSLAPPHPATRVTIRAFRTNLPRAPYSAKTKTDDGRSYAMAWETATRPGSVSEWLWRAHWW